MSLKVILAWIAIVTFSFGLLGGGYAGAERFFDLEERVAENTKALGEDKFFRLDQRRSKGYPLSQHDWRVWCNLGKRYKFLDSCGQRPVVRRERRSKPKRPRATR